jgi:hypothetical protein
LRIDHEEPSADAHATGEIPHEILSALMKFALDRRAAKIPPRARLCGMDRPLDAIVGGLVTVAILMATAATAPASVGCHACLTSADVCLESPASTSTDLVVPAADLLFNGHVTKCIGGVCQTAPLTGYQDYVGHQWIVGVRCGGPPVDFACLAEPTLSMEPETLSVYGFEAAEGDVVSVMVTKPDGAVVAEHTGVVAREHYFPNGAGCSPTCTHSRF